MWPGIRRRRPLPRRRGRTNFSTTNLLLSLAANGSRSICQINPKNRIIGGGIGATRPAGSFCPAAHDRRHLSGVGRNIDQRAIGPAGQSAILVLFHLGNGAEQPVPAPDQEPDEQEGGDIDPHAMAVVVVFVRMTGIFVEVLDRGGPPGGAGPLRAAPRLEPQHAALLVTLERLVVFHGWISRHRRGLRRTNIAPLYRPVRWPMTGREICRSARGATRSPGGAVLPCKACNPSGRRREPGGGVPPRW